MDLVESYAGDLRFARKRVTRALLGLLLLALAGFPLVAPDWMVFLATLVALYAIGVMGQNILIGYTGQISFGQAGFLAIGAFGFGHLRIRGAALPVGLLGARRRAGRLSVAPAEGAVSVHRDARLRRGGLPGVRQLGGALGRALGAGHRQAQADVRDVDHAVRVLPLRR